MARRGTPNATIALQPLFCLLLRVPVRLHRAVRRDGLRSLALHHELHPVADRQARLWHRVADRGVRSLSSSSLLERGRGHRHVGDAPLLRRDSKLGRSAAHLDGGDEGVDRLVLRDLAFALCTLLCVCGDRGIDKGCLLVLPGLLVGLGECSLRRLGPSDRGVDGGSESNLDSTVECREGLIRERYERFLPTPESVSNVYVDPG